MIWAYQIRYFCKRPKKVAIHIYYNMYRGRHYTGNSVKDISSRLLTWQEVGQSPILYRLAVVWCISCFPRLLWACLPGAVHGRNIMEGIYLDIFIVVMYHIGTAQYQYLPPIPSDLYGYPCNASASRSPKF
jgi:hypothetical protein